MFNLFKKINFGIKLLVLQLCEIIIAFIISNNDTYYIFSKHSIMNLSSLKRVSTSAVPFKNSRFENS